MYSASVIDRMTDDELMDALEKGLISPDDLD
jgi:predicted RNA-binding protein associated with RNAse of E/G family